MDSPQILAKTPFKYYGPTITERIRCTDLQMIDGILIVDIGEGEHA